MKTASLSLFLSLIISANALAQRAPAPVFVTTVTSQEFVDEIEALGTLQANENVNLTSSVTERITAINFESGQRVKKGEVLIEMDDSEEKALLVEEKSILAEAQRQVKRLNPLIERGVTSQANVDQAQLALETSLARIEAIESQIRERHIVAPFDGKLGLRDVSVGGMAQPGTLITTIDDDSVMKLDFAVPEIFLPSIQEGGRIRATAKAYSNQVFEGQVQSVDSRVNSLTRSISVRALLENEDYRLRPGMLMRVRLFKNPREALVIPEEAIVPEGSENFVFVVSTNEGRSSVKKTPVTLGSRKKGIVEILDGLNDGDQVVTHGTLRIQDGANVIISAEDEGNPSLTEMLQQNK